MNFPLPNGRHFDFGFDRFFKKMDGPLFVLGNFSFSFSQKAKRKTGAGDGWVGEIPLVSDLKNQTNEGSFLWGKGDNFIGRNRFV